MITCVQCGQEFELLSEEKDWYIEQFGKENLPKRCKACRSANKRRRRQNRVQKLKEENLRLENKVAELEYRLKGDGYGDSSTEG